MIFSKSAFFLALLALFTIAGCNDPAEQSSISSLPQVEVQVETLGLSTVRVQVELSGTLQAVEQATISARIAGEVVALPVKIASQVKKGDLLVRLSAEEINARVRQAEIQLEQARRNLARESKLLEVNASTRERVKTLNEQVQTLEAALREVQTMLGYTEITAPFSGTVTNKQVEVGDLVLPGKSLLMIENDSALEIIIQVPETMSHSLTLDSRLSFIVPAAGLQSVAKIRQISPTVDPNSRTTQIKLMLPDAVGLRSGQFARVALGGRQQETLLVKRRALRQNGQMQQVFVAEEGKARIRLVRTGTEDGERIEILSGLRADDRVIINPSAALRDGQPVVIVDGTE